MRLRLKSPLIEVNVPPRYKSFSFLNKEIIVLFASEIPNVAKLDPSHLVTCPIPFSNCPKQKQKRKKIKKLKKR